MFANYKSNETDVYWFICISQKDIRPTTECRAAVGRKGWTITAWFKADLLFASGVGNVSVDDRGSRPGSWVGFGRAVTQATHAS